MPAILDLQPCKSQHKISDRRYPRDKIYESLVHLGLDEPNASEILPWGVAEMLNVGVRIGLASYPRLVIKGGLRTISPSYKSGDILCRNKRW